MKKEVIKVPQDKDFLEFMVEEFGKRDCTPWFYIAQQTIDILSEKQGIPYEDTKGNLHIPYGNIIVEGYRFYDYSWYKIGSINADNVKYSAAADPDEIFFIQIR